MGLVGAGRLGVVRTPRSYLVGVRRAGGCCCVQDSQLGGATWAVAVGAPGTLYVGMWGHCRYNGVGLGGAKVAWSWSDCAGGAAPAVLRKARKKPRAFVGATSVLQSDPRVFGFALTLRSIYNPHGGCRVVAFKPSTCAC